MKVLEFLMTLEAARGAVDTSTPKTDQYFLRVLNLSTKLKLPPDPGYDTDARQEIPKDQGRRLLNGKSVLLGFNSFLESLVSPSVLIYAGVEGQDSWVRIGQGDFGVKILFSEMTVSARGYLQERTRDGVWETLRDLGGIPIEEFEEIVRKGESVTGLVSGSGSS